MENGPQILAVTVKAWTRRRFLKLTLSVPVATACLCIPQFTPRPRGVTSEEVFSTRAGEWRVVPLADGSKATLAPRTTINCRFDGHQRFIALFGGDVVIDIVMDVLRPFVIESPLGRARVLKAASCAFSHEPQRSTITSAEGNVLVSRREDAQERDTTEIERGQQIVIIPRMPLLPRTVDLVAVLAWTDRKVYFTRELIERALYQFNRVNELQLRLPDHPKVSTCRINGKFDLDKPEKFLVYVQRILGKCSATY